MQQPLKGKIINIVGVVGVYNVMAKVDVGIHTRKMENQLYRIHAWALVEYENGTTQVEPMIISTHGLTRVSWDDWKVMIG